MFTCPWQQELAFLLGVLGISVVLCIGRRRRQKIQESVAENAGMWQQSYHKYFGHNTSKDLYCKSTKSHPAEVFQVGLTLQSSEWLHSVAKLSISHQKKKIICLILPNKITHTWRKWCKFEIGFSFPKAMEWTQVWEYNHFPLWIKPFHATGSPRIHTEKTESPPAIPFSWRKRVKSAQRPPNQCSRWVKFSVLVLICGVISARMVMTSSKSYVILEQWICQPPEWKGCVQRTKVSQQLAHETGVPAWKGSGWLKNSAPSKQNGKPTSLLCSSHKHSTWQK